MTSLSLIIWVHWWKHTILDFLRIIDVHFALIPLSLSFMNWWFTFHGSMVVVRKLCLARIFSQLMHLCVIVIMTLLILFSVLNILLGSVVTQQFLLFLIILILGRRLSNLRSLLFVISFFALFLLHISCRSISLKGLGLTWNFCRRVIYLDNFKFILSILICIVHGIQRSQLALGCFKWRLF